MTDGARAETGWLGDTPDDDNLVRRFLANQALLNERFAQAAGGRVDARPGVSLADAGNVVPFVNQAVLQRPVLDASDPLLDEIDAFFASGGRPCAATVLSFWPMPDCARRGWFLVGHPAFVVRAPGAVPTTRAPGVDVQQVRDAATLAIAERVTVEGYPVPDAIGLPTGAVLPPALVDTDVRYRLGTLDGAPASVAASHVSHGVVNLCLAATLASARRRGVWEALVWDRVADAPDLPAAAFTSDDSRPGFARMGFLVVSRLTLWLRPPG